MKQSLLCIWVLALLWSCNQPSQKNSNESPNVIIIFTDDQGYQDVGCFGSPDILTPHLDQMANDGIRFTQFYVSQPVCSASRASLLTGCYANRLGIHGAYMPNAGLGLHPEEETIAEILKSSGYATGMYGKWHLGSEPNLLPTRQGFDEYFGIPYSNDMWPLHPWQDSIFDFPVLPLLENEEIIDTLEDQTMLTTWYTDRAVDFIERNQDQPFFLYMAHSMPHVPLYVSEKFAGKSPAGIYGDVISEIDWSVGRINEKLKELGLEENTLVVFTSDNGPWLSYGTHSGRALPLREGKGTAWEGGVRVPFIAKWPGKIPAGIEQNQPAMTIDLLPTIVTVCGANLPQKKIDGKDISQLLFTPNTASQHHESFWFYYHRNELHAILSGDGQWKLYLPHRFRTLEGREGRSDGLPIPYSYITVDTMELYNLHNDVSETKNVIVDHPEVVEELIAEAEKARQELGDALVDRDGTGNREVGKVSK